MVIERCILVKETSKPSVEPLVPAGAIEAIVRSAFAAESSFGPLEAHNSLLHIYEELRELYLVGIDCGINKPHDAVRLLLETASGPADAGPSTTSQNDDLVRLIYSVRRSFRNGKRASLLPSMMVSQGSQVK